MCSSYDAYSNFVALCFLDFHQGLPAFVERYDGVRQSDENERAGIADASVDAILQLSPMSGCLAEFIGDEFVGEGIAEAARQDFAGCQLGDGGALPSGGTVAPLFQALKIVDPTIIEEAADQQAHVFMQRSAAGDNDASRDVAIGAEAFEIFKISIVERVLVVPFDFERDARECRLGPETADVVDFV